MKTFVCPRCANAVFFRSMSCEGCGAILFYDTERDRFVEQGQHCGTALRGPNGEPTCNWNVATAGTFCRSCILDRPPTTEPLAVPFQDAKRRTIRQLLSFGVDPSVGQPVLGFDLRASTTQVPVMTGHAGGLITIDIAEADPVTLIETREELGEPYRTPLGHVRHELGHWFWEWAMGVLIDIDHVRSVFGDERSDYSEALRQHYARPDDGRWRASFLSFYASAHPWEDFAETFAHVLHMSDTLETAAAHGLVADTSGADFDERYARWSDLALALNDLNRSMGTPDPYPFVIPAPAIDKLRFLDTALRRSAA